MFRSNHEDALVKSLHLQNGRSRGPSSLPASSSTPPSANSSPPGSGYQTPTHHRYMTPPGSGYNTPRHHKYRPHLGYKAISSESINSDQSALTKDYWKERATQSRRLNRRSRSRSPCPPRSESSALHAPGISQEAITQAFVYPSSLHRNLRLVVWAIVTLHVSIKTLTPVIFRPMYDGLREFLTFSYGPR